MVLRTPAYSPTVVASACQVWADPPPPSDLRQGRSPCLVGEAREVPKGSLETTQQLTELGPQLRWLQNLS